MGEAKIKLTAEDNASKVIDHVTKKLGIFNKEGIAMGISFALTTKAVQLAQEGIQRLGQEFMKGIQRAIDFEYNLALVTNTIKNMDMSIGEMSDELHDMSLRFGVDINNLAVNLKLLTREGYGTTESIRMLEQAQFYAKAKGEDLASTIEAVNRAIGIFDLRTSDSGYILERYNEITTLTNLGIQDISDILGRTSLKIQEYGYNLNDVVNIMYTLAKSEIGPRSFSPAFIDFLEGEGFKQIMSMPSGTVNDLNTQMGNVEETNKSAIDRIGAAWDNTFERIGQGLINIWENQGIVMKKVREEIYGPPVKNKPDIGDTALHTPIKSFEDFIDIIKELDATIQTSTITVNTYFDDLQQSRASYQYAQDMHAATLEVRKQTDAIEQLRRIANRYSLEQQSNQLEILRIQYGASGRRGERLTRGEQSRIREIEQMNMGLRIKEMEQQVQIGKIQTTGLLTAQDNLDALKRAHDEVIYAEELETLSKHIDDVYKLWSDMYQKLERDKQDLLQAKAAQSNVPFVGPPASLMTRPNANNVIVNTVINTQRVDENTIAQVFRRGINRGLIDSLGIPNYNSR